MQVGTALAPGNSGFFSVTGQAAGMASGDPGAYGENVDDQREMFWDGSYKDGRFADVTGQTPQEPKDGVRIYSDEVYEDILFDGARHCSIASVPGMIVMISSTITASSSVSMERA